MHQLKEEDPVPCLYSRQLCQHPPGAKVNLEHLPLWATYHGVSVYELP